MILHGLSDIGKKRSVNQDNYASVKLASNAAVAVVCDGMGGSVGGSEASKLAINSFIVEVKNFASEYIKNDTFIYDCEDCTKGTVVSELDKAVNVANKRVYTMSQDTPSLRGMGTTLVAVFIYDNNLYTVNVGDSRVYSITKDAITQLTHDHSYVQYLVDSGSLTKEEARKSTKRNIITRAIGIEPDVQVDIKHHPLNKDLGTGLNDYSLILCSDGLTNLVEDIEIKDVVNSSRTPEDKTHYLIDLANDRGGNDNITIVLIQP